MKKKIIIETKEDVSDDLDLLASLLEDEGLCSDAAPLKSGAGFCRNYSTDEIYVYQINRLAFDLNYAPKGTVPRLDEGSLEGLKAILTINLRGNYFSDSNNISNPFRKLEFNLELECTGPDQTPYKGAWHLDKHQSDPEDGKPTYHHPEYHMAFGGKLMDGPEYGSLFLPPSPRICHPPMDAILGVDFILRNFIEKDFNESLFKNTKYISLIKKAQFKFWRPFSISFASRWETFTDITIAKDFTHAALFPELF